MSNRFESSSLKILRRTPNSLRDGSSPPSSAFTPSLKPADIESETRLDPLRGVVEEVLLCVRVLAWRGFTRRAWRGAMRRALDDDELLVRTGSFLEVDFAVPNEVMSAHGGDQDRDRDALDRASRGIVARAPIQVVHR